MLLALTGSGRGVDLGALDLNQRWYVPEGVAFLPSHLSKLYSYI